VVVLKHTVTCGCAGRCGLEVCGAGAGEISQILTLKGGFKFRRAGADCFCLLTEYTNADNPYSCMV